MELYAARPRDQHLSPGRTDGGADDADARGGQHAGEPVSGVDLQRRVPLLQRDAAPQRCGVRQAGSADGAGKTRRGERDRGDQLRARPR